MTFLFDIGNVLLKLHFHRFHQAILGAPDAPLPEALALLKDPYETGAITDDEFVSRSLTILKSDLSPAQFIAAWENIFSLNEPMWQVVRTLRENGHRLILFSNTNAIHARAFLTKHPEFALFDHHHFSQEIGAIKPHDDFYTKAIANYQLTPAETLYLDDLPENIATGKRLGFRTHQYDLNNHPACLDWLSENGVSLPPNS